jgi:hypothetical protein
MLEGVSYFLPFYIGREIDIVKLTNQSETNLAEFRSKTTAFIQDLNRASSDLYWLGPQGFRADDDTRVLGYDPETTKAPSNRPSFIAACTLKREGALWAEAQAAIGAGFELDDVDLTFQDFGIGCAKVRVRGQGGSDAKVRLTREQTQKFQTIIHDIVKIYDKSVNDAGFYAHKDGAGILDSLFHQKIRKTPALGSIFWVHTLFYTAVAPGDPFQPNDEWYADYKRLGFLPKTDDFLDAQMQSRTVRIVPVRDAAFTAYAVFGWGVSFTSVIEADGRKQFWNAYSLEYVFHIVQSFSAGLYYLNKYLISETLDILDGVQQASLSKYRAIVQNISNLELAFSMFYSLLREQRYCQNGLDKNFWENLDLAWGVDEQLQDTAHSLKLIGEASNRRKSSIEENLRANITRAITIITALSAAAVFFDVIPDFLAEGGVRWDLVGLKMLIVAALVGISLSVFVPPRAGRR